MVIDHPATLDSEPIYGEGGPVCPSRSGPQRSEDTRRQPAKPALDGVGKVLTGRLGSALS
jgi:hypothetical protein